MGYFCPLVFCWRCFLVVGYMDGLFDFVAWQDKAMQLILLAGVAVFFGAGAAKLIQKLKIPQIIGYVAVGAVLGPVLGILPLTTVHSLEPISLLALGIIGFLIGGELERDIFVKFGRHVLWILLFEGLLAFLLVGVLSFTVMMFFSDWYHAVAVAVQASDDVPAGVGVLAACFPAVRPLFGCEGGPMGPGVVALEKSRGND